MNSDGQIQIWCRISELPNNRYAWAVGINGRQTDSGEARSFRKAISERRQAMNRLSDAYAEAHD